MIRRLLSRVSLTQRRSDQPFVSDLLPCRLGQKAKIWLLVDRNGQFLGSDMHALADFLSVAACHANRNRQDT
jgi:hypothetical protein